MPATSLADVVSEEPESITISLDGGAFWLNDPREAGQHDYSSLSGAMQAGDDLLDKLWKQSPADIARSVGLDADVWAYANLDGLRGFRQLDDADAVIWQDGDLWFATGGQGPADTAGEAADLVVRRQPTP